MILTLTLSLTLRTPTTRSQELAEEKAKLDLTTGLGDGRAVTEEMVRLDAVRRETDALMRRLGHYAAAADGAQASCINPEFKREVKRISLGCVKGEHPAAASLLRKSCLQQHSTSQ